MEEKVNVNFQPISFSTLLTIVFIVLKLLGKITWSWLWVLSPLWISAVTALLIIILFFIIAVVANN